jgi:hypothetical protein
MKFHSKNKKKQISFNKTKKNRILPQQNQLCGSIIAQKQGWKILSIHGDPFERGFCHGYLLKTELQRVMQILPFIVQKLLHVGIGYYLETCKKQISTIVEKDFNEFYIELKGISAGAKANGLAISIDYLIAWNSFLSMQSFFTKKKNVKEKHGHCSAFIAVGNATENGDIIMAHSTHCDLITASLFNIILYVKPTNGFSFCLQTSAGFIASGSDFFLSSSGIFGSETTISSINYIPIFKGNYPYFCRIRKAIQYGKTLQDYSKIMLHKNSGDYANSWLFGDINTNTIMLCEIGLKFHNIQTTKNGVFYGMNSAMGKELRKNETNDSSHTDFSLSSGSRNARLNYLLNYKYKGKINTEIAKLIIADHFDTLTASIQPSSRTICNHSYQDKSSRNFPHLAVDAKICSSTLAKSLGFIGIFGSSCSTAFNMNSYINSNPLYQDWKKYLEDLPKYKWVTIRIK